MKLLVLLALCGSVSLTPLKAENEVVVTETRECAPQTPCGWATYNQHTKEILARIPNTYCKCPESLECVLSEDDPAVTGYILRCRTKDAEIDVSAR